MSSLPSLRLSDECYGEVYRLAVGGHFAQLVATLEQERCKGGGFQLTPATLLPDPTASPPRHSPLVQAAYSGHLEVVQYLISQVPTPDFINHTDAVCFRSGSVVHHCSPLLAAVFHGHILVARALLQAGAVTEIRDCAGATPLCEAVFHGHSELVQFLHESYGADVNAPNLFGWGPLHVAIDRGHRSIVDYLLHKTEADISQTTPEGFMALHIAAMKGRANVMKELIQMGAELGEGKMELFPQEPSYGYCGKEYVPCPLYMAAANSRRNVVDLLTKHPGMPAACHRDVKLLQGVVKLEQGYDPTHLWRDAFTGSRGGEGTRKLVNSASPAVEVYGGREEIRCVEDVVRLSQLPAQESAIEKLYQALIIRERCMGPGDSVLFWQLSNLAKTLLEGNSGREEVWPAAQRLLLRAVELFEENRLPYLVGGYILPQEMQADIAHWIEKYFSVCLSEMSRDTFTPNFARYVEFFFRLLSALKERTEALKDAYQCENTHPQSLLRGVLSIFHIWVKHSTLPECSSECALQCESFGKMFVATNLYFPDGSTLLHEAIAMWRDSFTYCPKPGSLGVKSQVQQHHHDDTLLLTALLEWGAAEVINVATPTGGDCPLHQLACALRESVFPNLPLYGSLLSTLITYGAHIDAVNGNGDTAYSICSTVARLAELRAELAPPIPPPLACLCCHRVLTWAVPYAQLHCLPPRVKGFIQLHDANKSLH